MAEQQRTDGKRSNGKRPETPAEKSRSGVEKRRLIVEAAIKVFAEKGYHGTRISDIAKHAEIAYGLVYHYFKNKEEILDIIFLERWGEFIDAVRAIAADGRGVEDKLLSIAAVILSAHRSRPEWFKVLIFEIQRTQRFSDPERTQVVGELFRAISDILREGQKRGELRSDLDPDLACYIFVGGLDIIVTSRVLDLVEIKRDEGAYYVHIARTVVDLFLNGMAGSLPRGGAKGPI
jgi:TetR/AcrR family fatty acid metabolism transcriptional regulator